ncbi:CC033 protein, partial [Amia calva]|nr:CC033 protein [Amia calva]
TKFGAASEIPVKFIEKNVSLRGKFHHVTENGIGVEHIPISVPVISRLVRQRPSNALLLIRLAGVELTEEGKTWLKHQLEPSEFLWFKLIGRQNDILDCLVSVNRGGVFSMSLNEEILRQGLGRTVPIDSLAHQYRLHWKVHRRLLRAEGKAEKKGKGLWKQQNLRERISAYLNDYKMLRLWKKLLKRIW